jgi:hypothetical protein
MHQSECGDWYSPETTDKSTLDINHITGNREVILLEDKIFEERTVWKLHTVPRSTLVVE